MFIKRAWRALLVEVMLVGCTAGAAPAPRTMRAVYATSTKPAGDLSAVRYDANHPSPAAPSLGQVLLKVEASSVNPVDYKLLETGSGLPVRFPHVLGFDVAGTVEAVGFGCSGRLKVGDRVWADLGKMELLRGGELGAWGEYALADEKQVGIKPTSMNFSAAGTLPLVGLTALQAFRKMGGPEAFRNATVVITSGSGGTGFVAVQMARLYGARRIITATSTANMAFVKSLGATDVIDYHTQTIWSTLGKNTVDLVYDNFGAPGTADAAMPALRVPGGVFLFLPGRGGALSKHPRKGVTQINYGLTDSSKYTDLDELRHLVDREDGDGLQSHIQETFLWQRAARAAQRVDGRQSSWKACNLRLV